MITLEEFKMLILEMRSAQKVYFKERSRENLIKAKILEGKVDNILKELYD
jgi:hypothetical protein